MSFDNNVGSGSIAGHGEWSTRWTNVVRRVNSRPKTIFTGPSPTQAFEPAEWTEEAACHGLWDTFDDGPAYPRGGANLETQRMRRDEAAHRASAVRICGTCPVQVRCLERAMFEEAGDSSDQRVGIRGGLTNVEREALARAKGSCWLCDGELSKSSDRRSANHQLCTKCKAARRSHLGY